MEIFLRKSRNKSRKIWIRLGLESFRMNYRLNLYIIKPYTIRTGRNLITYAPKLTTK